MGTERKGFDVRFLDIVPLASGFSNTREYTCHAYVGMAPRDNPHPGTGLMLNSGCTFANSLKLVAASLQQFCGELLEKSKIKTNEVLDVHPLVPPPPFPDFLVEHPTAPVTYNTALGATIKPLWTIVQSL